MLQDLSLLPPFAPERHHDPIVSQRWSPPSSPPPSRNVRLGSDVTGFGQWDISRCEVSRAL